MKVPLSWLKTFVDITLSPEELAHVITMAGLEVSAIHYIGVEGSELPWDREKILVANILEVKPHPNADLLVLAEVDYGAPQPHTVVTGAPNLFPYKGQGQLPHPLKSAFAKEGARLYDGHKEGKVIITLKGRPVRGVMSDAMLCSEKELGISDEHEGILFLDADAPVGAPLCDVIGEVVFDIDLTPNLARCLSIVGVAREVAALTGAALHIPDLHVEMDGEPIEGHVQVTIEEPHLCPRFTAGFIEGVTVGTSPLWMQRRLRLSGMRPINTIVDISNYVMLEWGQPTHTFDADLVQDHHLIVRLSRPGERLVTLDGKERDLTPFSEAASGPLLVCDPGGALAIAGVMGGATSEVSETTTRVLLEAAVWEPSQIRRTSQAFKLHSEASHRFERGVDIVLPLIAQRRALELMRTLAGGSVAQRLIDVYPQPVPPLILELPPGEVRRILGIHLSAHEIADMLSALGFVCQVRGITGIGDVAGEIDVVIDPLTVQVLVPSFRQDITTLADLCEEIARVYGYDAIPTTMLADEIPAADTHPDLEIEQTVRDLLVGCGLNEVITYSLTSMEWVAQISPRDAQPEHYLRLSNPITPEREYLRRSILPTLLEALVLSLRERDRVLLFEVGRVFWPRMPQLPVERETDWLPDEPRRLGLAIAGPRQPLSWTTESAEPLDFFDLKGMVEVLLARLGITEQVRFEPLTDDERLHPGRAARLVALSHESNNGAGTPQKRIGLGVLGELHPAVHERLELRASRSVVADLDLDALTTLVHPRQYRSISRYPASTQDMSFIVNADVPAAHVSLLIRRAAGDLLESLTLFDVYSGEQVGEGKRSLTYQLRFRAPDRTLNDESLAKIRTKIVRLLEREIGATIRS